MNNKHIQRTRTHRKSFLVKITAIALTIILCGAIAVILTHKSAETSTENNTTTSASSDEEKVFGTINEYTYINDYFGVAFDRMDDWVFADESERSLTDFYADDIYSESISLTISSLESVISLSSSSLMSDEEFLQYIYDTMSGTNKESTFQSIGLDEGSGSIKTGTVYFLGEDTPCIQIQGTISGDDFYETEVLIRRGTYYATITATNYYDDYNDEVLGGFYSTEKGGPLIHRDFDLLIGNEPVNILDYCVIGYPELFYYDEKIDESLRGVLRTARGIHLGDSLNQVIDAYGETKLYDFEENADAFTDPDYNFEDITSYAIYNYEENGNGYRIIFLYTGSEIVDSVIYECEGQQD